MSSMPQDWWFVRSDPLLPASSNTRWRMMEARRPGTYPVVGCGGFPRDDGAEGQRNGSGNGYG